MTDWEPLNLKGTQHGDVYLEMTFFAAGPSPTLARRPSKFTNPAERLARPQQPPAQRPQRVLSQPRPSTLSPGGQGSRISPHDGPRQRRPKIQQVPLPDPWLVQSAQQHQQAQPAGPNYGLQGAKMHRYHRSPRTQRSQRESLYHRSFVLVTLRARRPHLPMPTVLRALITSHRAAQTRMPILPIPTSSIKARHHSLHRRPVSVRLRRGRSHTDTRSLRIRRKGPRNMSDSHQADMQLRSLPLKRSLSSLPVNMTPSHNRVPAMATCST